MVAKSTCKVKVKNTQKRSCHSATGTGEAKKTVERTGGVGQEHHDNVDSYRAEDTQLESEVFYFESFHIIFPQGLKQPCRQLG